MKFDPSDRSSNIEVRRGGMATAGGLGIGGLIIAVIAMFMGVDPSVVLNGMNEAAPPSRETTQPPSAGLTPEQALLADVLGTTEKVWSGIFRQQGATYRKPKLVIFEGATSTACGTGQAAMGPFYCPRDEQLYVDMGFMRQLHTRFKAPGDFAQAYVIAHEVGHHVQKLTGSFEKLESARASGSKAEANRTSVRVELQADCYAGVWAFHAGTMDKLSPGDIEEGIDAAAAVGDDRLQRQSTGRVMPDAFTHGSSQQRVTWFKRGMSRGNPADCNP
ncbi:MAG TPA: neutral zinc metallopeptidase [Usitatibacter sp.]|nr:neutral zinc metallopeptidase [Usitatibacter sp.]